MSGRRCARTLERDHRLNGAFSMSPERRTRSAIAADRIPPIRRDAGRLYDGAKNEFIIGMMRLQRTNAVRRAVVDGEPPRPPIAAIASANYRIGAARLATEEAVVEPPLGEEIPREHSRISGKNAERPAARRATGRASSRAASSPWRRRRRLPGPRASPVVVDPRPGLGRGSSSADRRPCTTTAATAASSGSRRSSSTHTSRGEQMAEILLMDPRHGRPPGRREKFPVVDVRNINRPDRELRRQPPSPSFLCTMCGAQISDAPRHRRDVGFPWTLT